MHLSAIRQETKAGSITQQALSSPAIDGLGLPRPLQARYLQAQADSQPGPQLFATISNVHALVWFFHSCQTSSVP